MSEQDEIVVWGVGQTPCKVMIVGDRPGDDEALRYHDYGYDEPTPFIGASGRELDTFLEACGWHRRRCYLTYLVKEHRTGANSPDPAPADVRKWEAALTREIRKVQPSFILAVGRFATRYFLGDVDMDAVHGVPHPVRPELLSAFKGSSSVSVVVIPCYHPNFGMFDPDAKGLVYYDYSQAVKFIKGELPVEFAVDTFPHPSYMEVTSLRQLRAELDWAMGNPGLEVAIDTEGVPGSEWSLQLSLNPGTGLVLRTNNDEFAAMNGYLIKFLNNTDVTIIVHNSMYDIEMCRGMGLDITRYPLYDTMVAAYLLRLLPQGLKHLSRRLCGMEMTEYMGVIGDAADEKRIEYLIKVTETAWPEVEPRLITENDNTSRMYVPQHVARRAESILSDWEKAVDNLNEGLGFRVKPTDKDEFNAARRWQQVDAVQRKTVEQALGPFPDATLDDIPLDRAIRYSGRDPDATLRVKHRLHPMIEAAGLTERLELIMANIPNIEEAQFTGMLGSRSAFAALTDRCNEEMYALCERLSNRFNDGEPINPNSQNQVIALMERRGLKGEKRSKKTKKMSTAKRSIEHLRHEDDAMALTMDWRERQKTRDSFSEPILERFPEGVEYFPVRCKIRTTRVSSSRLSATDPPFLAIPVRHELGVAVRSCFVAPQAHMTEFWERYPGVTPVDTYFGTWDLSQVEMRVMAHLSRDPLLCKLFLEGRDIHYETAIRIFGLNVKGEKGPDGKWRYEGVKKKEQRDPTKRAGFGVITGIQGQGLYDQLRMMGCEGWDADKCDDLIREWFKVYGGVERFLLDCRAKCRRDGYVRDMGGMYRYLPGIWSRDDRARAEAERQSHSHIIQGTAQWMIQRAMVWLRPQIEDLRDGTGWFIRFLLQVHDELLYVFPQDAWPVINDLVLDALTNHSYKLSVPVEANGAYGLSWGALEK